jgi:hypothetical protein
MFKKIKNYIPDTRGRQRIAIALSKGGAMMHARKIDLKEPSTWEFSGFSQNGEDGIIDVLRDQLINCNRYFIEIGSSDGLENNTSWLAVAEKYSGIMVEGNPKLVERARRMLLRYSIGLECRNMFITKDSINDLKTIAFHEDPDLFSLDIDGNDFYIAKSILDGGFRPKIFVVEYNSVYGPDRSLTVKYRDDFVFTTAHSTQLYYGVSIAGWRNFFASHNYKFVTVDRNGVNAFFVDPEYFSSEFLGNIKQLEFAENRYQLTKFRIPSNEQFSLIESQKFIPIEKCS